MRQLSSIFICLLFFSCKKEDPSKKIDVNLSDFEAIEKKYPFEDIKPKEKVSYWELVNTFSHSRKAEILFKHGTKCELFQDKQACNAKFDSTFSDIGFDRACLPSSCFKFIRYQTGQEIKTATNKTEVINYLGNIDTKSEAILIAMVNGFYYIPKEKKTGAIRKINGGYKLLVVKTVSDCSPIQTDRFLIEIKVDGTLKVISQEVESISKGCI